MAEEMKPCPFCGGSDIQSFAIRDGRKMQCKCGASPGPQFFGPLDKPSADERLVAAWNTRTPPTPTEGAEIVERLLARATTLEKLGQENRPLTSEYDVAMVVLTREHLRSAATHITTQDAELTRLRQRVAELEGALKPFAGIPIYDHCPDEKPVLDWQGEDPLRTLFRWTCGDFRRATSVLTHQPNGDAS